MKIKLSVNLKYQSVVYVKFDLNSLPKLGEHHKCTRHRNLPAVPRHNLELYKKKPTTAGTRFITFINHEWSSLYTIMTKFTIKSCSAVTVRVPDSWTYQSCTDRLLKLHSHCIGNLSFLYWDYINKNLNYLQFSRLKTGRFFFNSCWSY